MISPHLFRLDTVFLSAELITTDDKYVLKYKFKDDTVYDITNRTKTLELNKDDFTLNKITESSYNLGNKVIHQLKLYNVKLNDQIGKSISDYKNKLQDLELIPVVNEQTDKMLNKKIIEFVFPDLLTDEITILKFNKPTLIDFWEVWCGPCIESFPRIEEIKKKMGNELQVVGVVTQDKENARKLIKKNNLTFLNLVGNNTLLRDFNVNSYPRYFLLDEQGIVRKEYSGFSNEIEKDIKKFLSQ